MELQASTKPMGASLLLLALRRMLLGRWMTVVAGFLIMSVSGAIYAFGVYSGALKTALGYNQKQLNTIGFFKDFGNIGILAGLLADLMPAPVVLTVGLAFNTAGYLMIWLATTHRISAPPIWQMYIFITIGGNSVAFTHAGALVTCVKNFPLHRGMIVGLLKGFLGLSTAILTLFYRAIYGDHPASFILLIVYLPLAVILCSMFFIRPLPVPGAVAARHESSVFYKLLAFELATAVYLMAVILVQHTAGVSHAGNIAFGALLALILCIPAALVFSMELKQVRRSAHSDVETTEEEQEDDKAKRLEGKQEAGDDNKPTKAEEYNERVKQDDAGECGALQECSSEDRGTGNCCRWLWTPPLGNDFTVWQALVHVDFWLLSIASTAGFGAGLMLIDNLGQVGAAFGYDQEQTGTFVSLISIWNCVGRVGIGFVSEYFLQHRALARPFFFAFSLVISAAGYLAIALALPGALFIGSILIGLCYGAQWALLHIIVSEIFGLRFYGTLQSIIAMASPLGTFLLSVRVAGYLYDKEASKQGTPSCHGTICYRTSFFIMSAVCILGCALTLLMSLRTMGFYRTVVYEQLKATRLQQRELETLGNEGASSTKR